uniref:Uncharacterized protein n=1 Tax=Octopus bimaculoides TaxID=37653 RepID=A0A0L8FJ81_OCTBM
MILCPHYSLNNTLPCGKRAQTCDRSYATRATLLPKLFLFCPWWFFLGVKTSLPTTTFHVSSLQSKIDFNFPPGSSQILVSSSFLCF